ncbi:DUF2516 family protein [Arthrobacter agilis]|uniref:DUF2516 family protein n=1 Tax=Arthrobacter agilis TaxID=37921 RepID=UPI000B34FEA6|nr:DUF2516 family protein [Arthrobacter agilis]OUM43760.1 hypothetical protein B8W74_06350 [Arthrobacter agilis]PPB46654.1 DUF2516 domain-containing protein [Arthrobacter agilis]TPV25002.1 DUF2516 family protein [Arthrobacter agilis]VDR31182.1 Protein of uncharacterised function (DUF2516) [Arthrobacter agilis]
MDLVLAVQLYLYLALGLVALGIEVWALSDCLRRPKTAFEAAFKRTKGFWLALTGGAVVVGLLSALGSNGGFNLFQLVAIIAACVYLADVKPAVSQTTGRGGNYGPYGPW